ncbi:flagellar export protein FliJ [Scandinavium sp. TWS1a]|uniref:flagellar export protein FliJ n=1 Tax=Scandinavium tedordense TaxID=2926521 RepID=UPI0013593460|nr:flagellar export protein FliJ [Scandinavium tedordense]MCS2171881.1 flagellar export protein FliJ [Scandinavium tedordense]
MNQMIDTLRQLQKLRDKSVQDFTVQLAKQKQVGIGFENNIRSLTMLLQKTVPASTEVQCPEELKNINAYKGSLRRVLAWQEQEKSLAQLKEDRIQKDLISAACQEKVVSMTLDVQRERLVQEANVHQQKVLDDMAGQCWLRQRGVK